MQHPLDSTNTFRRDRPRRDSQRHANPCGIQPAKSESLAQCKLNHECIACIRKRIVQSDPTATCRKRAKPTRYGCLADQEQSRRTCSPSKARRAAAMLIYAQNSHTTLRLQTLPTPVCWELWSLVRRRVGNRAMEMANGNERGQKIRQHAKGESQHSSRGVLPIRRHVRKKHRAAR